MSNTSTNYAELNVTNDDMKEVLAEGTSAPAAAEAAPKKQKNIGYRILALILTIGADRLPVLIARQTAGQHVRGLRFLWQRDDSRRIPRAVQERRPCRILCGSSQDDFRSGCVRL